MRQTFKSIEQQKQFEKYGYVIIKNFIDESEINFLKTIYSETKEVVANKKFYISQWSDNKDLKFKINDAVQKILLKKSQEFLIDYIPVFGVFGVKHPGEGSEMYLHGDWTHVDESKFRTVNVWSPLLDINKENGAICLLKGSNRLFNFIRGAGIPDAFWYLGEKKLQPYLTDIYLNAGDVIMWDHCIIHGSRVNESNETRVAAVLNMRPADSTFYLYFANPMNNPKQIDVFEPPADFFLEQDSANNPELIKKKSRFIKSMPYKKAIITKRELSIFLSETFANEFDKSENFNYFLDYPIILIEKLMAKFK
jgi:hypothetical protein